MRNISKTMSADGGWNQAHVGFIGQAAAEQGRRGGVARLAWYTLWFSGSLVLWLGFGFWSWFWSVQRVKPTQAAKQ